MKKAVREKDLATERQLVKDLDSDDPAVRLFAISALERLTGERRGYEYYFDDLARRESLLRWQQWLASQETAAAETPVQVLQPPADGGKTGG